MESSSKHSSVEAIETSRGLRFGLVLSPRWESVGSKHVRGGGAGGWPLKGSFIKFRTAARNLVRFLALERTGIVVGIVREDIQLPEATFRPMLIIVILVSFNFSSICSRGSPRISSSMFLSLSLPAVFTSHWAMFGLIQLRGVQPLGELHISWSSLRLCTVFQHPSRSFNYLYLSFSQTLPLISLSIYLSGTLPCFIMVQWGFIKREFICYTVCSQLQNRKKLFLDKVKLCLESSENASLVFYTTVLHFL